MGRGDIEARLGRLEEQAHPDRRGRPEEQEREKEQWLLWARIRRREALKDRDADHARSLIALFRTQCKLPGMGADELVDRVLFWRPVPEGGRSRTGVERGVALAIYRGEPGTEGMECPPAWRESFARGDELREKYEAIPEEVLAEGYARLGQIEEEGGGEEELEKWTIQMSRCEEGFGITEELVNKAIGPDVGAITEEECRRRIVEYLADSYFGEKAYRIRRYMEQIEKSGLDVPAGGEGGR